MNVKQKASQPPATKQKNTKKKLDFIILKKVYVSEFWSSEWKKRSIRYYKVYQLTL